MIKKIFITNGSGGCGKDTFAKMVSQFIPTYKYSSIDAVKNVARKFGWNGGKSEKDRKFLSDLKEVSSEYNDFSMNDISELVKSFKNNLIIANVLFIDIREPKDIERAKKKFGAKTILIRRNSVATITSNMADANVENYEYDYYINNDGSLSDFEKTAYNFVKENIMEDCGRTEITEECVDCYYIGINENGKYCKNTIAKNKENILSKINQALVGYKKTDTIPISGRLLYDICEVLKSI